jgi:hypothetical protein
MNRSMKNALLGLRVFLLAGTVMLLGTNAVISAPEKAFQSSEVVKPVQNKNLDFKLVNATGYDIQSVYMSPSHADSWGDNILSDTLYDGYSVNIQFSPDAESVEWDLRADWVMEEGAKQEYVYWNGLRLDEINKLTLKYNPKTDKTSAKIE